MVHRAGDRHEAPPGTRTADPPLYALPIAELARLMGREPASLIELIAPENRPARPTRTTRLAPAAVRDVLRATGQPMPRLTVAVMNLKGGVGKTTTCLAIASRAVQYGLRTCVVDIDAQGSASLALGVVPSEDDPIFRDVWPSPEDRVPGALRELQEYFSLLPSALENSLLDVSLVNPASQKRAVAGVVEVLRRLSFDLVVVDCPPSLGAGSISAACAADVIVVPAGNDAFSLRGIELTLEEVAAIRETFGLAPAQIRLLSTMVDSRETLSARYLGALSERYGKLVLPGFIRRSTEYSKALERRETVFASPRKSDAKADYDRATRALLGLDLAGLPEPAAALARSR
jgi:chromosome partitioning protein